jgi:glycolate oxidase
MLTWETMDAIREIGGLPFILKGVATAEDAAIAVEHKVDVIYISNHGGRQLDHGLGTIDMLPEIVRAVDGKADIVIDGGFLRGSDVVKALCLGAKAATIGKLQGWALAAAGSAGLVRALELMEAEIISTMGLLGVSGIQQLKQSCVRAAQPTALPHEMSTFVNIPGGRLT